MLRAYASGRIFGERYGEEPVAVLALHGWARTHVDFAAVLGGEPSRSGLAVDLPGHGASPAPGEPWGSLEYARALVPVVEALPEGVVVIGHSFGGRVGVHLAALCPGRIGGLVLSGVPLLRLGPAPRPATGYRFVRGLARTGIVSPALLARARERYGSADYRAATGLMREVLVRLVQEEYVEPLRSLTCPVELVWGELDSTTPVAIAERAVSLLADGRLTVLPGVGHLTPTEAPEALQGALERLLS